MLKSANIGELVKAIAEAQADYKALVATHEAKIPGKDGKAGYSYTYADLNDGLDALQKTLNSRGVAVIQEAYTVDRGIEVVTMLAHGEQWMESKPLFMPVQGAAQAVGSAITYGRRYSLFPMVGLAPADDDGEEANRNAPQPSRPEPKPRASKPAPAEQPEPAADSLGPRCVGKAAPIATAIDKRIRELAGIRNTTLAGTWRTVLVEAGIDVVKYGDGFDRPALLAIPDGKVLSAYLEGVLEQRPPVAGEHEPVQLDAAGMSRLRAECQKIYNRLCNLEPADYVQGAWAHEWARVAGLDEWPEQPTAQHLTDVRAGLIQTVKGIEAHE